MKPSFTRLFVILAICVFCSAALAQSEGSAPSADEKARAFVIFTRILKDDASARTHVDFLIVHEQRSPWRFSTLVDLTLRLAVAGYSIKDIDASLRPAGDMVSALSAEPNDSEFARIVLLLFELHGDSDDVFMAITGLDGMGVPVYQLLAEATGESVPKVKQLARSGRLRGHVVKEILLEWFKRRYDGLGAKLAEKKRAR